MYQNQDQKRAAENPAETTRQSPDATADQNAHEIGSAELLAPFGVATVYVGLAATVGPALFDTGSGGTARIAAFGLLGLLLHVAGYATLQLYTDARRRLRDGESWQPNPWHYVCGGALVLVTLRVVELGVTGRSVSDPLIYLLGNVFVAVPLSSIVAGPAYWLQRRRSERSSETCC